jgi:hypothetical protein
MRRQMPGRIARYSRRFEIGRLVTDLAAHRRQSETVFAARDRRLVQTLDVALARAIAGGMAVHAVLAWPSTVRIDLPLKFAAGTMQVGLV